ncbi:MAG: hypothetical protein ACD_21C00072G0005 [uncultured bacterium]|nr:MAG: hypothetical protein ACD_21C00072G0005 [uncultured bacterium]
MRYLKFSVIFGVIFLLVGCGAMRKLDKSDQYKNAPTYGKSLTLPSDMNKSVIEDHYPVPKAGDNSSNVSILPPGSNLGK